MTQDSSRDHAAPSRRNGRIRRHREVLEAEPTHFSGRFSRTYGLFRRNTFLVTFCVGRI